MSGIRNYVEYLRKAFKVESTYTLDIETKKIGSKVFIYFRSYLLKIKTKSTIY